MKEKICYVVCAGESCKLDFKVNENDLVIAADGGLEYLKNEGLAPDIIIGDFDSLGYEPKGENVIKLNVCKDEPDSYSAVERGMSLGYDFFKIYCATGGRIDHTIANIQLLSHIAEKGGRGEIYTNDSVLTVIKNGEISFGEGLSGYISVFSLSDKSRKVSIENLKYELKDAEMTSTFPIGTSNEFVGKKSRIEVKNGTLLIVFPR